MPYLHSFKRFILISLALLGLSVTSVHASTVVYDYSALVTNVVGSASSTVNVGDIMTGQISWDLSVVGVGAYSETYPNAGGFSYSVGEGSDSF